MEFRGGSISQREGADPGGGERGYQWRIQDFPEVIAPTLVGGVDGGRGTPTYEFAKFFQKLYEIERVWIPGARVPRVPLDPPMDLPMIWHNF